MHRGVCILHVGDHLICSLVRAYAFGVMRVTLTRHVSGRIVHKKQRRVPLDTRRQSGNRADYLAGAAANQRFTPLCPEQAPDRTAPSQNIPSVHCAIAPTESALAPVFVGVGAGF